MSEDEKEEEIAPSISYAFAQLAKALVSKGDTAAKKIEQWQQVIQGMASKTLRIGEREPVPKAPIWVTLQVVHGGYATGNFSAGGSLLPHEVAKLSALYKEGKSVAATEAESDRTPLNVFFASDDGRLELSKVIHSGLYRVNVPEEAALLVFAWLVENSETERASDLVETIGPLFDKLRFYPEPAETALKVNDGESIFLHPVSSCINRLTQSKPNQSVLAMIESIRVWTPLLERMVSLFLETVDGELPHLMTNESRELMRRQDGQPVVSGGWPCKSYPPNWQARAQELLKDCDAAAQKHNSNKKYSSSKSNFSRLKKFLNTACLDPATLSGRDVGYIRKILASHITAHGAPGSSRRAATSKMQTVIASQPLYSDCQRILAERLRQLPREEGISDLDSLLAPLTEAESAAINTTCGAELPAVVGRKILMAHEASLSQLVAEGVVTSSETMASVLSMLTARVRAQRITDKDLARIFESSYRAFRRRRSLLLLNYEQQARFEELPWISAIGPWIGTGQQTDTAIFEALKRVVIVALTSFPQTIMPNKLVKELRALSKSANLKLFLVDELAADIFMGSFAGSYLNCAQDAARLLQGSLYERYYSIDYAKVAEIDDVNPYSKIGLLKSFESMCKSRAGETPLTFHSVAHNGKVIEQAQILTTHNLASLWLALGLDSELQPHLPEMARNCYRWICRRLQLRHPQPRTELQTIKNCAYAWRQMIFFLSMCDENELQTFITWSNEHLQKQSKEFQTRFASTQEGLAAIARGDKFDNSGNFGSSATRFTGWTTEKHHLRRFEVR